MTRHAETQLQRLTAAAVAHHEAGRFAEAEAEYRAALALAPGSAAITHNLGVLAAAQGRHAAALSHFDEALAAEPQYAAAHYNRGVALERLGRTDQAVASLSRACALEPGHYDAHRALGFLWLAKSQRGRALDHFARTYELRRGEDRSGFAQTSLTHATRCKLAHDAEQLGYIATRRRDGKRFQLLQRAYAQVADTLAQNVTRLSDEQLDLLGEDYNGPLHIASAPELAEPAVNPALDRSAIARSFAARSPGATFFDGLLSPQALASLQRYLLESTIWHDFDHIGGFVASYLEDGLASPLLLQIADEIRQAFPQILGPHPLSQAWAFKALEGEAAVAAHADDAAVSVNIWLTPDGANLAPGRGGLSVCRMAPPEDWHVTGYDEDIGRISEFMAAHADETMHVPYGENRAVLFEARLFHRSDTPRFAPGYVDHRINLTLLYGR